MKNYKTPQTSTSRTIIGAIIMIVGGVLLFNRLGYYVPSWIFSWSTFLIALGLFLGARRNFTGIGWLIMVCIGAYFTLDQIVDLHFFDHKYLLGAALVFLGAYLIFKPKRGPKPINSNATTENPNIASYTPADEADRGSYFKESAKEKAFKSLDYIDLVAVFGGAQQMVYSKNFKGGDIVAVFGGADVNLHQTDFEQVVKIEIIAVFGGVKLIVPPHWEVKSDIAAVFGGVDDKRLMKTQNPEVDRKLLVIEGLALFGGIDIKTY